MKRNKQQVKEFIAKVSALRFDDAFNPYAHTCADHDVTNAPELRRSNLAAVLEAAVKTGVHSLWIARDLGYRGGRRTGLALTDEMHLTSHAELLRTRPLVKATKGPVVGERTAAVVWRMLRIIHKPIFLWNVFPLHPHSPGDPLSNRCHSKVERAACGPLLHWLIDALRPCTVVAIGRDAQVALKGLDISAMAVRHPSYGGQTEFVSGLREIYGLPSNTRAHEIQSPII